MKFEAQCSSDYDATRQQAATTTYDLIETQALLKQLTQDSGRSVRKEHTPAYVKWVSSIAGWFRRWAD